MTETPVPDVPEENELLDEMREAELEDVLVYVRQVRIDAGRFGASLETVNALQGVYDDLKRKAHR